MDEKRKLPHDIFTAKKLNLIETKLNMIMNHTFTKDGSTVMDKWNVS